MNIYRIEIHCTTYYVMYNGKYWKEEGYYQYPIKDKIKIGIWFDYNDNELAHKYIYNRTDYKCINKRYYLESELKSKEYTDKQNDSYSYKITYLTNGRRKSEGSKYINNKIGTWHIYEYY